MTADYKSFIVFLLLTIAQTALAAFSSNVVTYTPTELVGKEFVFCASPLAHDVPIRCFYSNIDTLKLKASSKDVFLKLDNGSTPLSEIYNHSFKTLDILFKVSTDYSKGFFLKLLRDDGKLLWMKFDKFNTAKYRKMKDFSDLFYVRDSYRHLKPYKTQYDDGWETIITTKILLPIYDVTKIKSDLYSLEDSSKAEGLSLFRDSIPVYSYGKVYPNSDGVTISLSQDSNVIHLTPAGLSELAKKNDRLIADFHKKEISIQRYDSLKIDKLKKLIGKNMWANTGLASRDHPHFYDNQSQEWLTKADGTGRKEVRSSNFMSMRGINRINCDIVDLVLLPNCIPEDRRQAYYYNMTPVYGKDSPRFNDYCYYIVIKPSPDKSYWPYKSETFDYDNKAYIMINDIEEYDFLSSEELEAWLIDFYIDEKADIEAFNNSRNTRYEIAKAIWGTDIANLVLKGEIRFGFSQEMCKMAYHSEPFQEGTTSLPLGRAEVLDYPTKETKLYFINDKLIGIQFKLGEIRYR